jgi:hypothetical protein
MQKLVTRLPFGGFYDSKWSEEIDIQSTAFAENEAEYRQAENGIPKELQLSESEIINALHMYTDYSIAYRNIAHWYVGAFNDIVESECGFKLKLEFESMTSPREYNFETNRIYAYVPANVVKALWVLSKRENHVRLENRIAETYTSRSGFISFYDNSLDGDDWKKPVVDWDANQICTLIEALTDWEGADYEWVAYYRFAESHHAYDFFDAAVNWEDFEAHCADEREEKREDLLADDPDFVPSYRCPDTPDLFQAMFNEATRAYFEGKRT